MQISSRKHKKNQSSFMNLISRKKNSNGITLIALVITIIVLLILAGVAIASLTGENGILTKASTAKTETEKATAEEEVKLEIVGSYDDNGKIDYETFKTNVENNLRATVKDDGTTCTVTHKGYDIIVNKTTGKVISTVKTGETPPMPKLSEVAQAKQDGTVFEENTELTDDLGNLVKIPAGFKIGAESATAVTGGIVIEDATYQGTIGSEFVWIPVGDINTSATETVSINLDRYTFDKNGNKTAQGNNNIISGDYYFAEDTEETHNSSYANLIATDIDNFITKATASGGYYIGRYEARVNGATFNDEDVWTEDWGSYYYGSDAMWTGYTNGQLVCKPGSQVWSHVTQNKASDLSKNMYTVETFTSDLMNSYAWDTATLFLQTFDDRTLEGKKVYSRQNSLNTSSDGLANTGTNSLVSSKQDKICNVWDMASNCREWTTETCTDSNSPCVDRGGDYNHDDFVTSFRSLHSSTSASSAVSFRPLLYLED